MAYYQQLKKNTTRGNRADGGRDELGLAFLHRRRPDGDPHRARPADEAAGPDPARHRRSTSPSIPEPLPPDRAGRRT